MPFSDGPITFSLFLKQFAWAVASMQGIEFYIKLYILTQSNLKLLLESRVHDLKVL